MAGILLGGILGTKRGLLLSGMEWFWLVACTALVTLGWVIPDMFRPYFWNHWMFP